MLQLSNLPQLSVYGAEAVQLVLLGYCHDPSAWLFDLTFSHLTTNKSIEKFYTQRP